MASFPATSLIPAASFRGSSFAEPIRLLARSARQWRVRTSLTTRQYPLGTVHTFSGETLPGAILFDFLTGRKIAARPLGSSGRFVKSSCLTVVGSELWSRRVPQSEAELACWMHVVEVGSSMPVQSLETGGMRAKERLW